MFNKEKEQVADPSKGIGKVLDVVGNRIAQLEEDVKFHEAKFKEARNIADVWSRATTQAEEKAKNLEKEISDLKAENQSMKETLDLAIAAGFNLDTLKKKGSGDDSKA